MMATGEEAITLIKDTYHNHEHLTETEFIQELLRLSFQA
jgi:predicted xylose isomerase-like sugar epimerase